MTIDLWIPAGTPSARRAGLASVAGVHEYGAQGPGSALRQEPLGRADMLVASHDLDAVADAIARLENLRVVQTLSAGVDWIVDLIPAGITLCDASGVHDIAVAEWVVMAILAANRRLPQLVDAQRLGTWRREGSRGQDLDRARVLILGHGSIGRAVERRLGPFGVELIRVARSPREGVRTVSDLPELLPAVDVLVVLLPLTAETRGFVDRRVLSLLQPGALVVNASRGAVVHTGDLMAAVTSGGIRAALDVTDPEPLPAGHPLWSLPGVLITPHVGGDVDREEDRAWALVADQAARLADGRDLRNVVVDGY
jgi:phosphoglycerate dehydrogenase-like enzyme